MIRCILSSPGDCTRQSAALLTASTLSSFQNLPSKHYVRYLLIAGGSRETR